VVNVGPVTLILGGGKDAHPPRRSAVWLRSLAGATARPCEDQYSVLFHQLFAMGVTSMPRGLHARLCHAFLAFNLKLNCLLKFDLFAVGRIGKRRRNNSMPLGYWASAL